MLISLSILGCPLIRPTDVIFTLSWLITALNSQNGWISTCVLLGMVELLVSECGFLFLSLQLVEWYTAVLESLKDFFVLKLKVFALEVLFYFKLFGVRA